MMMMMSMCILWRFAQENEQQKKKGLKKGENVAYIIK